MRHNSLYRWRILSLVLFATLSVSFAMPVLAVDNTTVSISPATRQVSKGQEFIMEVVVDPKVAIAGVQFDLTFDPNLVTVKVNGVAEGDLLSQDGTIGTFFLKGTTNNTTGKITGVAGAITEQGGTISTIGTFAIITFIAGTTDGTSTLNLSNVKVGDADANPVLVQVSGGSVTVGTIQPGDANGDGTRDATDITSVERIIAGLDPMTAGADANQDGDMNALDITKVERLIAGLD